jgi:PucR C-terminal helix-turn-helix domain
MNDHDAVRLHATLRARVELARRLRDRSSEIEEAILAHVRTLTGTGGREDAEYAEGLKATIAKIVEYGLEGLERGEVNLESIPETALAQVRRAARSGVRIEIVLRRYAAGERLLTEFIIEEGAQLLGPALRDVLRAQRAQIDHVMAAVADEYLRERERLGASPSQTVERRVRRLLDGGKAESVAGLDYEFDNWHLGVIVVGAAPAAVVRGVATELDCQLLVVPRCDRSAWAWLGSRSGRSLAKLEEALPRGDAAVAVGEPRKGLDGWRLTHHEAQAAFQVMLRKPQRIIRASDVVLLAAILRDETLARSLRETYMAPLDRYGSSGVVLRETLRAYLASGRNAVTAAAALGIDRHTVQRRLRKVEDTLGRILPACHAELEVALGLDELEAQGASAERAGSGFGAENGLNGSSGTYW